MRIAEINMCTNGSTGRIMMNIAKAARARGYEARTFSAPMFSLRYKRPIQLEGHTYYGNFLDGTVHYLLGRFTAQIGCFSIRATKNLVKQLEAYDPDVIHLHNLHGFSINLPILFEFLKKSRAKKIWTLHDCWSFTGHCAHYTSVKCDKWKTGCGQCEYHYRYPKVSFDNSAKMYRRKKQWFTGVPNMTIVTPSQWLAKQVKQSFLADYPIKVLNNGVDLELFSDAVTEEGVNGKHIILGVAYNWNYSKGLDVFIELAKQMSEEYQIVLVGTDAQVDTQLPDSILSIHRTENQQELAKIYAQASVFVNPTREDTFPTVNIEALAAGTPVITFNVGGSPEIIDETCGIVVDVNDISGMIQAIHRVCEGKVFSREKCTSRAKRYHHEERLQDYIRLMEE